MVTNIDLRAIDFYGVTVGFEFISPVGELEAELAGLCY